MQAGLGATTDAPLCSTPPDEGLLEKSAFCPAAILMAGSCDCSQACGGLHMHYMFSRTNLDTFAATLASCLKALSIPSVRPRSPWVTQKGVSARAMQAGIRARVRHLFDMKEHLHVPSKRHKGLSILIECIFVLVDFIATVVRRLVLMGCRYGF